MTRPLLFALILFSYATSTGSSLPVYFYEGFDGPAIPPGWSQHQIAGPTAMWNFVGTGTNPPIPPYAGIGQAKFNSYDAGPEEQTRLVTPALNLSSSIDPFVEFMFHHDDEFPAVFDSVYMEATTGDSVTGPWMVLHGTRRPRTIAGWERVAASLLSVSGNSRVFVAMRGVSKYGNNMYVDEFRIADSSFHDIGTIGLVGETSLNDDIPASERGRSIVKEDRFGAAQGDSVLLTFVQNFGTFAETAYEVYWDVDFNLQSPIPNSRTLPRTGRDTFLLPLPELEPGTHAVRAWTVLDADSNRTNDTTTFTLLILDTAVVFVENFNSEAFPPVGWTAVNRDGSALGPWFRGSNISVFLPLEGLGFAANNFQRASGQYIDDYLISPAISSIGQIGMEDTLAFWVHSALNQPPFANYPDSLMILLSTSGTDTTDFTIMVDYFAVPKGSWVPKEYVVSDLVPPNSTIHIAFRYLHYAGGPSGGNSDFIGLDAVQVRRGLATSINEHDPAPASLHLDQNYPNPFNPSTTISYQLSTGNHITLKVYDVLGREVVSLVDAHMEAGQHSVQLDGGTIASGMYFYKLVAGEYTEVRKMVLMK
ncbi:MAG: choice-of-anchor J domain-containing protein [Bacteroidota bacterium]